MIISKTPYRISFFGGGTDYPQWFKKNSGKIISTTIDKHIYITCRHLPKFFEHDLRIVYSIDEMFLMVRESISKKYFPKRSIDNTLSFSEQGHAWMRDEEYTKGPYFLQPYVAAIPPGRSRQF